MTARADQLDGQMLGRRIGPQLGPLDDEHALGTRQLVMLEAQSLERSAPDRAIFAEAKQVDVHEWDRTGVDHADRVRRAAHARRTIDAEPTRERSHQRGLACAHRTKQQHHVAPTQASPERLGPRAHARLVEFALGHWAGV